MSAVLVLAACLLGIPLSARDHYGAVEVTRFNVQPGLTIPEKFKLYLQSDLQDQLKNAGFHEIVRESQTAAGSRRALRVVGVFAAFQRGNRLLRYGAAPLGVAGVGRTRLVARFKVLDRATGELLLEGRADGKVLIGPFGGDTMGATNGLAKEIAKKIAKSFL